MDDPRRIILDISSDEDVGWGERGVNSDGGGCGSGGRDDSEWILELLNEVERKMDDSDEVVCVGEVIANPKQRVAKPFANCVDNEEDDDDDECVILDGDPDKPVAIENDGGEDSDDLCVVGEKGQVACRDYPHPRHLCVKFPFNSTPHERHCDRCHCYVCELVAPCVHWGGLSSVDHCHATEKDEFWKALREGSKTRYKAPPLVSGTGLTSTNQVPSLPNNPLMHNQEQPANQPCSITSIGTSNCVMPVRTQESGFDLSNKFQPHLVSHYLQRHNVGNAGNPSISQHVPFKRPGMVGGVVSTDGFCNKSSRNNYGYQFSRNQSPGSRWQDPRARGDPMLSTYQGSNQAIAAHSMPNSPTWSPIGNGLGNYAPSQPQMPSQMHSSSVNANSASPHPQLSSRTCMGSNFANSIPTVPGVATRWGCPYQNPMPSQPQAASQPNVGSTYQNVVPSQPLVTSHGNINYSFESHVPSRAVSSFQRNTNSALQNPLSYQPQPSWQPPPVPNNVQNGFRQDNESRSPLNSSSADANFNWDTPTSQNSQSFPAECTQLQSAVMGQLPAIAINSQLPSSSNPLPVDFQFNPGSLEDKSALEDLDIPVPPVFNIFSPESAPLDSGILFDI